MLAYAPSAQSVWHNAQYVLYRIHSQDQNYASPRSKTQQDRVFKCGKQRFPCCPNKSNWVIVECANRQNHFFRQKPLKIHLISKCLLCSLVGQYALSYRNRSQSELKLKLDENTSDEFNRICIYNARETQGLPCITFQSQLKQK